MERIDRIMGALFGVACGDALGGTLEFMSKKHGKSLYGYHKEMIGGGLMHLKPGEVTDDTMMTIAVAEGIIENKQAPINNIGEKFISWYNTDPKDIGITCSDAISKYLKCGDWNEASLYVHNISGGMSAGNGSLMRCIPVALCYGDIYKLVEVSRAQSKMTHFDEKASDACIIYNMIVYKYLNGENKDKAVIEAIKGNKEYENIFSLKKEMLNPSGYVVDSLKCALYCFLKNSNVGDIICEAVNLYGDPDTIGAIAGGLAGAYYGYSNIPERWRNKIILKNKLKSIAEKLN